MFTYWSTVILTKNFFLIIATPWIPELQVQLPFSVHNYRLIYENTKIMKHYDWPVISSSHELALSKGHTAATYCRSQIM